VQAGLVAESVDEDDAELFAELCEAGIISVADGRCSIRVLWLDRAQYRSLNAAVEEYWELLRGRARALYRKLTDSTAKHSAPNVADQVPRAALLPVMLVGMFVLKALDDDGCLLVLSEDDRNRIMTLMQGEHRLDA